jgi:hypothetical protein
MALRSRIVRDAADSRERGQSADNTARTNEMRRRGVLTSGPGPLDWLPSFPDQVPASHNAIPLLSATSSPTSGWCFRRRVTKSPPSSPALFINALPAGTFHRYRLRPSEFSRWIDVHPPVKR